MMRKTPLYWHTNKGSTPGCNTLHTFLVCWAVPCLFAHFLALIHLVPQAQRHTEAAKLLVDTAIQLAQQRAPPLQIKKLYVLAALEVEAFKKKTLEGAGSDGATAAATLLGTAGAATATRPPGTTRGPGRAANSMPTQTVAAAQTLAGGPMQYLKSGPLQCYVVTPVGPACTVFVAFSRGVKRAVSGLRWDVSCHRHRL